MSIYPVQIIIKTKSENVGVAIRIVKEMTEELKKLHLEVKITVEVEA